MRPQARPVPELTAGQLVMHGRYPYLAFPRTPTRQDQWAACQALERVGAEALAEQLWESLNPDIKVSLFVRYIDLASGKYTQVIKNKF